MKHDIFISYRRADRELVAAVARRLEARGVGVWYDAEIEGGADWRETIVEALTDSDMLAIFFSEACNASRQLKKELAVADSLAKPVIPILIENTQPRGAYLYELADRNWIQAWPDPMAQIDVLVDHLATLAGKSEGGLAGARPVDALKGDGAKRAAPAPAPHAEGVARPEPDADEIRLDDMLEEASPPQSEPVAGGPAASPTSSKAISRKARDYVGRIGRGGKPVRKLSDIPPFRWIDLVVLAPAWLGIAGWRIYATAGQATPDALDREVAFIALLCLAFAGLYGAIVFPVRYFLRGHAVAPALLRYLATSLMYLAAGAGLIVTGMDRGYMEAADLMTFLRWFAIAWGSLSVLAFLIYGVLAGQRAIRRFRSNLRKI